MAGRTKDKKAEPSTRSKKPAVPSPDDLPLNGGQHVVDLRGCQSRRPSYGKDSQHTRQADRFPVASGSREREVGIQLTTSTTQGSSDLLWITTDRPTDFKDAKVQKLISKHVMRDFQLKDQSGKDSGRSRRKKSSQSSQSDDDFGLRSQQTKMPIVERSGVRNSWLVIGSNCANTDSNPQIVHLCLVHHQLPKLGRLHRCSTRCTFL